MNQKALFFAAGVAAALATGALVVSLNADAAPFSRVATLDAANAKVTGYHVDVLSLDDGGVDYRVSVAAKVPVTTTLPDGGTKTESVIKTGSTTATGALRTQFDNFATGPALSIVRQANDLER